MKRDEAGDLQSHLRHAGDIGLQPRDLRGEALGGRPPAVGVRGGVAVDDA
jgi:hypothetical protein